MKIDRSLIGVLFASFALALIGCGGGGGNGGGGAVATGTFTGSVSGTVVVAVNAAGDIVAQDDTTGKVPNAAGNFAFSLSGVPTKENIRIFLISHGAIYPMFFDSNGDGTYDTNVFSLTGQAAIDLGFVDSSRPTEIGKAIPANNPTANSAFTSKAADPVIPIGLDSPELSASTADASFDNGIKALASGWVIGARAWFFDVVDKAGTGTSTTADAARFMYALTRVAALGFETLSDGNSADMNRLGDLLDRLGVANDITRSNWDLMILPRPLPSDSPTGNEYRDFIYSVVGGELAGAIANLSAIAPSFTKVLTSPIDGTQVELRYSDVLVLRGIFDSLLATIDVQRAYDLDGDVDVFVNTRKTVPLKTVQSFLPNNPNFLTLADPTKLAEAKSRVAAAIADFNDAIDAINAEGNQGNDLVTLDRLADPTGAEAKALLSAIADSLANGATSVGTATLDLAHFFDDGIDLRALLPPFEGNNVSGLLPDPTFDGVVLSPDLNEDLHPADGVPDVLQRKH